MATEQRIDNFQGTLSEYVVYLETKVKQLTTVYSPPSSPQSDVCDEGIDNSDAGPSTRRIEFIPYEPDTLPQSAKRRRKSKPRWQKEMDNMLRDIPSAEDWSSKRRAVGLSSLPEILVAFDAIIKNVIPSIEPTSTESDCVPARFGPADAALQITNSYANGVAAMEIGRNFTTNIVNFCTLVFVSLCHVLVYHGIEKRRIDIVMQACVSQSDPKNLDVLRRGSGWVNRMISTLVAGGLRHLGTEIFVLCGRTVAQYGRFADAGEEGSSYFLREISKRAHQSSEFEVHASLPFSIPFFIKTILGEIYSLSEICTALCYDPKLLSADYLLWLEIYRSRKLPPPQIAGIKPTASSAEGPHGPVHDYGTARGTEVPPSNINSIDLLLAAAGQKDYFRGADQLELDSSLPVVDGMGHINEKATTEQTRAFRVGSVNGDVLGNEVLSYNTESRAQELCWPIPEEFVYGRPSVVPEGWQIPEEFAYGRPNMVPAGWQIPEES
ncbi:hypothetical protein HYALB_00012559 [Hymenoscyphus albidus]|uniref:Uncharacterized protein n=1 Tax=Hymenoscyphus albidus TaxID=595503 RepID=A0A9N9LSW0_9HELO|nr:hypothetical protein HYALB_00012559 [Hymenoscyphus albidus]